MSKYSPQFLLLITEKSSRCPEKFFRIKKLRRIFDSRTQLRLFATVYFFKKFFLVSYEEELAKANGLPVTLLNILMMLLAAITVSLSIRVVGILLIGALMVIPVLSAVQFGKSFLRTAIYSILISLISVITGLFASFYLNLPSGGTIVVIALIFFGSSLLINRKNN